MFNGIGYVFASGNTAELWKTLADPEEKKPLLCYAGEHTDSDYFATVHGAYLSGQRAAQEVIDSVSGTTCLQPLLLLAVVSVIIQYIIRH